MVILLNPKENKDLNFHFINDNLNRLEIILEKHEIYNKPEFIEWRKDFEKIYGKKYTNLHLYIVSILIYSISYIFISKFILTKKNLLKNKIISHSVVREIEKEVKIKYKNLNIFRIEYFNPFFSLSEEIDLNFIYDLLFNLSDYIFKLKIRPEYLFDYLIQNIISPLIRHKSGEYYTPPFLAKQMVEESYSFGEAVLDPCCGSGNFLTEVVKNILSQNEPKEKKIEAINMIYGYDINPISIYVSKINLLYLLKDLISEIKLNLYVFNSLFHVNNNFKNKFDLVVGNPPWYTYRDIESVEYQEKVKNLAEELEIKPLPKNLLNLEISTLFFSRA